MANFKRRLTSLGDEVELALYIKEGEGYKHLLVPLYVVRDLVRDRLSDSELDRIRRLAQTVEKPEQFKAGSVLIDFSERKAVCFQAGLNVKDLEPTWTVEINQMSLDNY